MQPVLVGLIQGGSVLYVTHVLNSRGNMTGARMAPEQVARGVSIRSMATCREGQDTTTPLQAVSQHPL